LADHAAGKSRFENHQPRRHRGHRGP
jgi:hypothetical protein